jgi:DNA-binding MarR family transcriptional regulator
VFDPATFVLGVITGAAGALAGWGVLRWLAGPPEADLARPDPVEASTPTVADPPRGGWTVEPPAPAPTPPATAVQTTEGGPSPDMVRLSERIVIELARVGRLSTDLPARPERTQQGLAGLLGSNQSAVAKVLRRLVAAGILLEDRRHVAGDGRRLKVYSLTRSGELLAREVATRYRVSLLPAPSAGGNESQHGPLVVSWPGRPP